MKTNDVEQLAQGGTDWLEWRKGGLGSSDIPIVMGESEFSTPRQLWMRKTGRAPEQEINWAMQRGVEGEPKIRALYELRNDMDMPPVLMQHPDLEWARASMDGYNEANRHGIEIKFPGEEKHELAKAGNVPGCYYGQVQWQLFVSGAKVIDYVSFDGETIEVVPVRPDAEYWERMLPTVRKFWEENILCDVEPEMSKGDYRVLEDEENVRLFAGYAELKRLADDFKAKAEQARQEIITKHPKGQVQCAGYRLIPVEAKGTVDYSKIPSVANLTEEELEKYRKKGRVSLTLKPVKADDGES